MCRILFELNRLVPNGMLGGVRGGINFPLLDPPGGHTLWLLLPPGGHTLATRIASKWDSLLLIKNKGNKDCPEMEFVVAFRIERQQGSP